MQKDEDWDHLTALGVQTKVTKIRFCIVPPVTLCEALGDLPEFPPQSTTLLPETRFVSVCLVDCLIEVHDKEFG